MDYALPAAAGYTESGLSFITIGSVLLAMSVAADGARASRSLIVRVHCFDLSSPQRATDHVDGPIRQGPS
jgi:hypothetical protein